MTGLVAAVSLLALSGPAPVTLTVRYFDGSAPDHVAHLRCRGASSRADGFLRDAGAATACRRARKIAAIGDWQYALGLLPRARAGRAP